ncbi:MAG TPA: phosphotransferase [Acidimicrobiia bacterium]|nr:phosphotransferase [Acidimicrobiia bacterium]
MLAWEDLTEAGRMRRLRSVAFDALARYDITVSRLRLVGGFTNVIFRVDADEGVFAARIDLHQDHSDADVDIETAWLHAIRADTDLDVACVVPSVDGASYVHATAPGVPGSRRCVLFRWIPGRPLADSMSRSGYEALGILSARLHQHGASWVPPHPPMRWDRIHYWPERVDPVVVDLPEHAAVFSGRRRSIYDRAVELVEPAFAALDPGEGRVLHGDLHPWNVHRSRNRIIAFDFEDVMWGNPVQDIAITLFYQRNHPEYDACRAAFENGYRSIAPWPETSAGEIERFMAARTLMFINYTLNLGGDPSELHTAMFKRLERFADTWA